MELTLENCTGIGFDSVLISHAGSVTKCQYAVAIIVY